MLKKEAQVVLAKCTQKHLYGIRMEKQDSTWLMTWAFPLNEQKANAEGFSWVRLTGNCIPLEQYPGCPYCGTKLFVVCNKCGRLSCYHEGDKTVTCHWCGNSGEAVKTETDVIQGGDM